MSDLTGARCKECRYFDSWGSSSEKGECKRYAPRPNNRLLKEPDSSVEATVIDLIDEHDNIMDIGLTEEGLLFFAFDGPFYFSKKTQYELDQHLKVLKLIQKDFCFPLHPDAEELIVTKEKYGGDPTNEAYTYHH